MTELFEEFQLLRKILCICPCCGDLVRVSDLRLKVKGPAVRTWLDDYEADKREIAKREEAFGEEEDKLRELAREKGRIAAEKVFRNAICPSLKALKLDPFDVKPILHPIDFVVFKGMTKEETISDIILLTRQHDCPSLNPIREQIRTAVLADRYDWQVARINEKGIILFEQEARAKKIGTNFRFKS
jgi:predicted Holliday junction resolvase-like endonuclease